MDKGVHKRIDVPMIQLLKRIGFDVTIVAPRVDEHIHLEEEVEIHWADWKKFPLLETMTRLRGIRKVLQNLLPASTFDVGVVDIMAATTLVDVMKENIEFPFIIDERSPPVYDHLAGRLQWILTDRGWKKVAPNAAACLVQSTAHVEFIKERYHMEDLKFLVYRNAVDITRFTPSEKSSKPIVTYTGTLRKERGIHDLVEAVRQINMNGIPLRVKFFGHGPMEKWLNRQSSKHTWLDFEGWISDEELRKELGRISIGVIPHPDRSGWRICSPIKMLEYAASGMVVIARDLPSHREFGTHDWFHLVDRTSGHEALMQGLMELIKKNDLVELGEKACRYARENMTIEASANELIEFLEPYLRT